MSSNALVTQETGIKKGGLARKMVSILKEIARIPKNGENKFHNYKYVTESDMVDYLRPKLAEVGVMLWTSIPNVVMTEGQTQKGNRERNALVTMELTFEDIDTGEERTVTFYGEGADASDKAVYKGITGAEKYGLMKTFLVSTGDDPEHDEHDKKQDKYVAPPPKKTVSSPTPVGPEGRPAEQDYTITPPVNRAAQAKMKEAEKAIEAVVNSASPYVGSEAWPKKYCFWIGDAKETKKGQKKRGIGLSDKPPVGGQKDSSGMFADMWVNDDGNSDRLDILKEAKESKAQVACLLNSREYQGKTYWNLDEVSTVKVPGAPPKQQEFIDPPVDHTAPEDAPMGDDSIPF